MRTLWRWESVKGVGCPGALVIAASSFGKVDREDRYLRGTRYRRPGKNLWFEGRGFDLIGSWVHPRTNVRQPDRLKIDNPLDGKEACAVLLACPIWRGNVAAAVLVIWPG